MAKALYNKYRSQDFDQLIGQDHITKLLKNAVKSDSIAHSYLFIGSRGTGKTSTARILAKAINCSNIKKDGNPCGECKNCMAIVDGNMLDLIEIDAASNRGIDQIRELKEKIEFAPSEGRFKVYIIDEVHMLTKEAFNALLKTLEEPPSHVVFILATTDSHKLPATILSRCQRYDFKLGEKTDIEKALKVVLDSEGVKFDKDALELLIKNANGSYRDALSLLDVVVSGQESGKDPKSVSIEEVRSILGLPEIKYIEDIISCIKGQDIKRMIKTLVELETKGVNPAQFVTSTLEYLKDLLIDTVSEQKDGDLSADEIISIIDIFVKADNALKYSNMPLLVMESIILSAVKQGVAQPVSTVSQKEKKIEEREIKEEIKKAEKVVDDSDEEDPKIEEMPDSANINVTLDMVKEKWENIVVAVKGMNPRLCAFIKNAQLVSLNGNELTIEVAYQFHKDRLSMLTSKEILLNAINSVLGAPLRVSCEVNSNLNKRRKVSADVILPQLQKQDEVKKESSYKPAKVSKKVEEIFAGM